MREDLKETPGRVQRAYEEMFDGYDTDIDSIFKTFDGEGQDQIVVVKDIVSWSVCEHHLLSVELLVHVAYLPRTKVIGASKIERLVHAYAHRLQLQERIARQIADAMMNRLAPQGVAVIIEGIHGCMRCRGVKSQSSKMVNSIMLGLFREDSALRMEVLSLLGLRNV